MVKAIILASDFEKKTDSHDSNSTQIMDYVAGKPFLEHQINLLKDNGIKEIIISVRKSSDKIKSYFGSGLRWGLDITYSEEQVPVGTAGAIKKAQKYIDDTFLVLQGNSYMHIDIQELLAFHKLKKSAYTACLIKTDDIHCNRNVLVEGGKVVGFSEKSVEGHLTNTGIYVFSPSIMDYIESDKESFLEEDVLPVLAKKNLLHAYVFDGYFVDLSKPETYGKFKQDVLDTLLLREHDTVRDALKKISKSEINLVLVVDEQKKLQGVITERIIRRFLLDGGDLKEKVTKAMAINPVVVEKNQSREVIDELLLKGINSLPIVDENRRVVDVEFRVEKIKNEVFPVVRGRAPLRVSFSGGGTDIPYYFEKFGGAVISATINKYCHATIIKRADKKIIIDYDATPERDVLVDSIDGLSYNGNLDLVKSVIKNIKPDFGFELYLHNDLPPGRGLGSSASLAVLIVMLLGYIKGVKYSDHEIAEIAYKVERDELKIKGGWQDQHAAATGGFNFMEFTKNKNIVYPLRLKEEIINELNSRLLLCYVGQDHNSSDIHDLQEKNYAENEQQIMENLNFLKSKALDIKDCLLSGNLDPIGTFLHESWERKKQLATTISNPRVNLLYEIGRKNGASGGKLLGAGNGGYILFFHSPTKKNQLIRALNSAGGETLLFDFEKKGAHMWTAM